MLTANNYVVMEIACTRSSYDLFKVRQTYHVLFKKSLEEDVAHHTTGHFSKVRTQNPKLCFVFSDEFDLAFCSTPNSFWFLW